MWTTKIISVDKGKLTANYTVEFYKDAVLKETFVFNNVSKPESIDRLIYDQLSQYKKMDEAVITTGLVDLSKFTPVVPEVIPPTPEQIALAEYIDKMVEMRKWQTAISLGITDNKNLTYLAVQTYLKNNFDPAKHLDILN
jgi:hypothetical protein